MRGVAAWNCRSKTLAVSRSALKDQPLVEACVRNTIGMTLRGLGRYADAEHNLWKSLEIHRIMLANC